ncbi:hypothetical protein L0F63_006675, partial [Massospora cicadina]
HGSAVVGGHPYLVIPNHPVASLLTVRLSQANGTPRDKETSLVSKVELFNRNNPLTMRSLNHHLSRCQAVGLNRTLSTSALNPLPDMVGSVNLYHRHVGILTPQDTWPARLVEIGGFHRTLADLVRSCGPNFLQTTKLTNLYSPLENLARPVDEPFTNRIILFPHRVGLTIRTEADFGHLKKLLLKMVGFDTNTAMSLDWIRNNTELYAVALGPKFSVVVCTHNEVDCRCGRIGTEVFDAFKSYGERVPGGWLPFKTSHIGGHRYAGNVIVYPMGDWYGGIQPSHVGKLVEHLNSGTIFWEHWRGGWG